MIYVTDDARDADILPHLQGLGRPYPIQYGDFVILGAPIKNEYDMVEAVRVSGDRKKLTDLISCMRSGHYVEQIRMAREGGFNRLFMIFEHGPIRPSDDGLLQYRHGKEWRNFELAGSEEQYSTVTDYLNELFWLAGVQVHHTRDARHTGETVVALYRMFAKPPSKHHLLDKFYVAPVLKAELLGRPALIERMAKELPGVGWERSKAVRAHFGSVRAMVNAGKEAWLEIPGIGQGTVDRIWKEPTW